MCGGWVLPIAYLISPCPDFMNNRELFSCSNQQQSSQSTNLQQQLTPINTNNRQQPNSMAWNSSNRAPIDYNQQQSNSNQQQSTTTELQSTTIEPIVVVYRLQSTTIDTNQAPINKNRAPIDKNRAPIDKNQHQSTLIKGSVRFRKKYQMGLVEPGSSSIVVVVVEVIVQVGIEVGVVDWGSWVVRPWERGREGLWLLV